MYTYIALLRGINVGGKNKVAMQQLKAAFEAAGLQAVRTYINSGNVIFQTNQPATTLAAHIETIIEHDVGFPVSVLVWEKSSFLALVNALPSDWQNDSAMKCDVMFLWHDYDSPDLLEQLPIKPEIDRVIYHPGALIWSVDRNLVTRSGMLKLVGTQLYKKMTIRNCNTVRKLALLVQEQ